MSFEKARNYLEQFHLTDRIIRPNVSTATVPAAAQALGVEDDRIAKTLSFRLEDSSILIVMSGEARIDNRKYRERFGVKARMLEPAECTELIGHEIGGVCPFGINEGVLIYLDTSLRKHKTVFPATGDDHSAIELTPQELFTVSEAAEWIDVHKEN